jgi:hypothetical protein
MPDFTFSLPVRATIVVQAATLKEAPVAMRESEN